MTAALRGTLSLCALVAMSACGGSTPEEDTAETVDTTGGETEAVRAEVPWAEMSPEQRGAFMRDTVVPEMQAMFQEHDAERFADFGCATCHGETARDVGFRMPNGVAPLDPSQIPAVFQSDRPMAQFMTQRVWPRMAELLGEAPYDSETGAGFSCLRCHATVDPG